MDDVSKLLFALAKAGERCAKPWPFRANPWDALGKKKVLAPSPGEFFQVKVSDSPEMAELYGRAAEAMQCPSVDLIRPCETVKSCCERSLLQACPVARKHCQPLPCCAYLTKCSRNGKQSLHDQGSERILVWEVFFWLQQLCTMVGSRVLL